MGFDFTSLCDCSLGIRGKCHVCTDRSVWMSMESRTKCDISSYDNFPLSWNILIKFSWKAVKPKSG